MNDVGMVPTTLPPDPALEEQQRLQRARMMGQMLQQPEDTGRMVGKHYVAPNPQNQMLKLLGAYLSGGGRMPGAQPTPQAQATPQPLQGVP